MLGTPKDIQAAFTIFSADILSTGFDKFLYLVYCRSKWLKMVAMEVPPPQKDDDAESQTTRAVEPLMLQSVIDVLKRKKGHDIAMKALGASHEYVKAKAPELKTSLLEGDSDLITISEQFLDQEKRIKSLKLQVQGKNRELAKLRQEVKDSSDRAIRFTDALIDSK